MKLYVHDLSGHSHRVRLFAGLLGQNPDIIAVDLLASAHKAPEYLAKNPFGQVPTLEDGDVTLYDSNAILVYLARRYDPSGRWYPNDPVRAAQVQIWLSKAANELAHGVAAARLVTVFGAPYNLQDKQRSGHALLAVIERQLEATGWLVGDGPTIADVAHYSYIAHGPEGGVSLASYPHVRAWLARIEALPGFVPMVVTETDAKKALVA